MWLTWSTRTSTPSMTPHSRRHSLGYASAGSVTGPSQEISHKKLQDKKLFSKRTKRQKKEVKRQETLLLSRSNLFWSMDSELASILRWCTHSQWCSLSFHSCAGPFSQFTPKEVPTKMVLLPHFMSSTHLETSGTRAKSALVHLLISEKLPFSAPTVRLVSS